MVLRIDGPPHDSPVCCPGRANLLPALVAIIARPKNRLGSDAAEAPA
jgi:hypothetical protein